MRIESSETKVVKSKFERNIIKDVQKEDVKYAEKLEDNPQIKRYGRPSFSEGDIREKVEGAEHAKRIEAEKLAADKAARRAAKMKLISSTENGELKSMENPVGDIQDNDPSSEHTKSKLKDIVKQGSFNFSEKERKLLASILNK